MTLLGHKRAKHCTYSHEIALNMQFSHCFLFFKFLIAITYAYLEKQENKWFETKIQKFYFLFSTGLFLCPAKSHAVLARM